MAASASPNSASDMKLIILDRDGVINEDSADFIKTPDEWIPIPGSLEAISQLNHSGYQVAVISNQSGIARGLYDIHALNHINDKMYHQLSQTGGRIDCFLFCPHHPDDHCECRKPKPGLFKELKQRMHTSLKHVFAVGDALRDLQAAQAAGAKPVLVRTGKGKQTEQSGELDPSIPVYDSLTAFVDQLLKNETEA